MVKLCTILEHIGPEHVNNLPHSYYSLVSKCTIVTVEWIGFFCVRDCRNILLFSNTLQILYLFQGLIASPGRQEISNLSNKYQARSALRNIPFFSQQHINKFPGQSQKFLHEVLKRRTEIDFLSSHLHKSHSLPPYYKIIILYINGSSLTLDMLQAIFIKFHYFGGCKAVLSCTHFHLNLINLIFLSFLVLIMSFNKASVPSSHLPLTQYITQIEHLSLL